MNKLALLAAVALAVGGLTPPATAQEQKDKGRGGWNPDEMRARMTERVRELLEVKNEDEWKLIQVRIEKATEAQREVRGLNGDPRMLFSRSGDQPGGAPGADQGGRTRSSPSIFGGTPNPDAEAFSKAVQNKAPTDELKQRMARVREARKAAEAKYDKAADDLRQVLTVRQEATLVAIGLLK